MVLHSKKRIKKVRIDVRNMLISACSRGDKRCLILLMSLGADLRVKDDKERSLLQIAYANNRMELVECIVTHDAEVKVNLTKFIDKWNKKQEKAEREYTNSEACVVYNNV